MIMQPYSHVVTPSDIHAIKTLGYRVNNLNITQEQFINEKFPNLDLFRLLNEINNILSPVCNSTIEKVVHLNSTIPPEVEIIFRTDDSYDEDNGLALSRIFTWEQSELIVKHEFFQLPKIHRGKGIAKQVFKSYLQQYINMDVKKIKVYAALEDGGYVWAKCFFTGDYKSEMTNILNSAEKKLSDGQFKAIKRIYDNYYIKWPNGKAFPIQKWAELPFMEAILRGSHWNGSIDLKNIGQLTNFMIYVIG